VEIPITTVPVVQKKIIALCRQLGKPVITATQMMESMMTAPRPTRSEVTDVANAVLDGTDAVMLSGETAAGNWPARVVTTMRETVQAAEGIYPYQRIHEATIDEKARDAAEAIIQATCAIDMDLDLAAILCWTESGESGRWLSRIRPRAPILAATPNPATYAQLALSWGIEPMLCQPEQNVEGRLSAAVQAALARGLQPGALVAVVDPDVSGLRRARVVELITL
jgi:pyruvate kinase